MKNQDSGEPEDIIILYLTGCQGEEDIFVNGHEVVLDVELDIEGRGEKPEGFLSMDVELLR